MENICKFVKTNKSVENINIINFVYEKKSDFKQSFITSACHSLYLVISGNGVLHTLNGNFNIEKGNLFFTFSAKPYYIESLCKLKYMYISFIGLRSSGLFDRLQIKPFSPVYKDFNFISHHWLNVFKETNDNNIDLKCESLLLYTFSFLCNEPEENMAVEKTNNILLLKQFIDLNYTDPYLNLSSVSQKFHYNSKYVSSAFIKLTKISFTKYLCNLRIKHSQALLKSGMTNITEIALASGFSDSNYYSKVFKKNCGISPRDYIKKLEIID